ncbi:MAG: DUF4625 domain-containing protein [Bacteroidota bacterium]
MKIDFKSILLIFVISAFGCGSEEVDLIAPTMDVSNYTPEPVEAEICGGQEPVVFLLEGGGELSFNALFRDDVALSQYKVDVHNNFDCHGHGGGSAPAVSVPNVNNQTTDWTILEIADITGTSAQVSRSFNVPDNVTAGNYHFHIQVIDESGNDSPFANFFSLKIQNPADAVSPQISVEEPTTNSFSVQKGETIRFKGQVTDNRSLSDGGNGVLYLAYTDLSSGNTFATNAAFPFDANVSTEFNFDFEYEVPQTLVAGNYRFSLGANDGVRNVAPFVFFDLEIQ